MLVGATTLAHAPPAGPPPERPRASSYSAIADERFTEVLAFLGEELRRARSGQLPEHQQGSLF